jgi:hypothetical protein
MKSLKFSSSSLSSFIYSGLILPHIFTSGNFYRSLPNWTDLQAQKVTCRRRRPLRREETTEEESPEDIRQRNMKEAEILASNLGEGGINAHEILSDVGQLKGLAQLQESMACIITVWSICVIQGCVHYSLVCIHALAVSTVVWCM